MNKKIATLLMAAALTTGMGGYGTYAYFTGADTVKDTVNITMGNLEVNGEWATLEGRENTWESTSAVKETEELDGGQTLSFSNVKPGDTFERTVIIVNDGTLNADITVKVNPEIAEKLDVELINVSSSKGNVEIETEGEKRYYQNAVPVHNYISGTVKVTVPTDANNEWINDVINVNANEFLTISAHQTINN